MTMESNAANLSLLEEIFEKYEKNPSSVDPAWRSYFESLGQNVTLAKIDQVGLPDDLRVINLINAYRRFGHLMANVNPIATHPIEQPWQLKLETLGFSKDDLNRLLPTCGIMKKELAPLSELIETLKTIYCDKIGIEYMEIHNPAIVAWLQERIEPNRFQSSLSMDQKKMILQQLNRSELFESFLHMKYTAQKRFSLEGGETLIPMLEAIVETGSRQGIEELVFGMAHRGRLNVLSNILRKSHSEIFSEFEEGYIPNSFEGSGDVKYHKGFSSKVSTFNGNKMRIILTPNPSHLESVDPVVEGEVHAKQVQKGDDILQEKVMPVLVHGDAALSGQGIIYETLQFNKLPGYSTGGTVHIVINNQIGFTATPEESRSTRYCSDIARAFDAPIFHVNAEDPEGCVYVTNLAISLRQKFHCDVFIDMNCYRKYGHNESDEPAFTQPLEYQLIRKRKPIREIYRDALIHQGVLEKEMAESLELEFTQGLQQALQELKNAKSAEVKARPETSKKDNTSQESIKTGVSKEVLLKVAERISDVPKEFSIHPKLHNLVKERLSMVKEEKPIDWGMAELLAYGTLLWEGTHVRLSGQDSCRGTFSHRHAIWMDQKIEQAYTPLCHLKQDQGRFDVLNSSLSEFGVLGFEYGYSIAYLNALVIWEAQFGDFCNGAQVLIDQYITTGEQKWGQTSSLVMFLPHGYEGQGPEHSSGRMERFLTLCGDDNIRVVDPTTPAQFFHLLRRQVKSPIRKPLVVFTPKGLLRHPQCVSQVKDLVDGEFQEIIDDPTSPTSVKKLLFCTGRIYYDLMNEREKGKVRDMAIIRLEQLYPLNIKKLSQVIDKYKGFEKCFWVQEEPCNMGAWEFIHPQLQKLISKEIQYVGRPRSASPAAGSYALHKTQHSDILNALFKQ